MYINTIIEFSFCDMRNYQGLIHSIYISYIYSKGWKEINVKNIYFNRKIYIPPPPIFIHIYDNIKDSLTLDGCAKSRREWTGIYIKITFD